MFAPGLLALVPATPHPPPTQFQQDALSGKGRTRSCPGWSSGAEGPSPDASGRPSSRASRIVSAAAAAVFEASWGGGGGVLAMGARTQMRQAPPRAPGDPPGQGPSPLSGTLPALSPGRTPQSSPPSEARRRPEGGGFRTRAIILKATLVRDGSLHGSSEARGQGERLQGANSINKHLRKGQNLALWLQPQTIPRSHPTLEEGRPAVSGTRSGQSRTPAAVPAKGPGGSSRTHHCDSHRHLLHPPPFHFTNTETKIKREEGACSNAQSSRGRAAAAESGGPERATIPPGPAVWRGQPLTQKAP